MVVGLTKVTVVTREKRRDCRRAQLRPWQCFRSCEEPPTL